MGVKVGLRQSKGNFFKKKLIKLINFLQFWPRTRERENNGNYHT